MRHARSIRPITALLIASAAAVAACGGSDEGGTSGGDGIVSLLRQMPAIERRDHVIMYTYGDLASATELAKATRPTGVTGADDVDALVHWALAVSAEASGDSTPTVAVPLPDAVDLARLGQHDEFAAEIGWSLADIDRFLELSALPDRFTLIDGTVDTAAVEDAVGPARNDIWSLGTGDDFESAVDETSPARPLGIPVRMATRDDLFVVTPSSDMAGDFVDGEHLGADEAFTAVAEQLDAAHVYGAYLTSVREGRDGSPFDTIGMGVALDDEGPSVVIVYHYAEGATASDAVADVEAVLEGDSLRTEQPWSEIFPSSEVTAEGANVVATLRLDSDRSPAIARQILFAGDSLVDF